MAAVKHGSNSGYFAGCRQECCRAARRTYADQRRRHIAYGRWNPWGDLEQVRAHVAYLIDSGMSTARIARAAGLGAINHVQRFTPGGCADAVTATTARRILSVTPDAARTTAGYVPAEGVTRRLQALACLGWSTPAVARESGLTLQCLHQISGQTWVRAATHRAIDKAYDRLSMAVPPDDRFTARVRNRARRLGWIPPLSWDEELLDLPEHLLAAEIARQVGAMDETELGRCYRAVLAGERSPVMAAAAPRYLEVTAAKKRARRTAA